MTPAQLKAAHADLDARLHRIQAYLESAIQRPRYCKPPEDPQGLVGITPLMNLALGFDAKGRPLPTTFTPEPTEYEIPYKHIRASATLIDETSTLPGITHRDRTAIIRGHAGMITEICDQIDATQPPAKPSGELRLLADTKVPTLQWDGENGPVKKRKVTETPYGFSIPKIDE